MAGSLGLGLALVVTGCASSAIGLALVKLSSDRESALPFYRRWRAMIGLFFVAVVATALDVVSYSLVPLSIISMFAGLTMVFTICLAVTGVFHVREQLSRQQLGGAVLVLIGITLSSTYGPRSSSTDSIERLVHRSANPTFISFAFVTLSLAITFLVALVVPRLHALLPTTMKVVGAGYTASVCGTYSQLFMKVVSIAAARATHVGPAAFAHPAVFVAITWLLVTTPMQFVLLNVALACAPISFAVPIYQALLVMLTTTAGGLFFHEFARTSAASNMGYALGFTTTLLGVVAMSAATEATTKPDPKDDTSHGLLSEGASAPAAAPS
jgi:drug/metabolite transporter (DMT)-like permease